MGLTRVVAVGTMCGADASFAKASPSSPLSSSSEHSDGAVVEPPRLLGLLEPPRSSLTEPAPLLGMLEPARSSLREIVREIARKVSITVWSLSALAGSKTKVPMEEPPAEEAPRCSWRGG